MRPPLITASSVRGAMPLAAIMICIVFGGFLAGWTIVQNDAKALTRADIQSTYSSLLAHEDMFGPVAIIDAIDRRLENARSRGSQDYAYLVRRLDGRRVAGNLAEWPTQMERDGQWVVFNDPQTPGIKILALQSRFSGDFEVLVGKQMRISDTLYNKILPLAAGVTILNLLLMLWWTVSSERRVRGELNKVIDVLDAASSGTLQVRLPDSGRDDEFSRISSAINVMLARQEESVDLLKNFSSTMAHELHRPIRQTMERIRSLDISEEVREDMLSRLGLLSGYFTDLLYIIGVEKRAIGISEKVNLAGLVKEAFTDFDEVIDDRKISVRLNLDPCVCCNIDRSLLLGALGNIISNAITFSPDGADITVELYRDEGAEAAVMNITDEGPGVGTLTFDALVSKAVFGKLDGGRMKHGLGLRLVQAIAKGYGLTVALNDPGKGLTVQIIFPMSEE